MFLEYVNYEIEGAAYDSGRKAVVDGVYLTASVKRRAEPGDTVVYDGPETPVKVPLSSLTAQEKTDLLAAYNALETIVAAHVAAAYAAQAASPDALDERISLALQADKARAAAENALAATVARSDAAVKAQADAEKAQADAELARDLAEIDRLQKELEVKVLDEQIAAKRAELAAAQAAEVSPAVPVVIAQPGEPGP